MKQKLTAIVLVSIIAAVYYGVLADDREVVPATARLVQVHPSARPLVADPSVTALPQLRQPTVAFVQPLAEPVPFPVERPLQTRYIELARDYSELLTDEELQQAIEQLETAIAQRNAEKYLGSIREALQKLIEEFPDSEAARHAKRMLEASASKPFRDDGFAPPGHDPHRHDPLPIPTF